MSIRSRTSTQSTISQLYGGAGGVKQSTKRNDGTVRTGKRRPKRAVRNQEEGSIRKTTSRSFVSGLMKGSEVPEKSNDPAPTKTTMLREKDLKSSPIAKKQSLKENFLYAAYYSEEAKSLEKKSSFKDVLVPEERKEVIKFVPKTEDLKLFEGSAEEKLSSATNSRENHLNSKEILRKRGSGSNKSNSKLPVLKELDYDVNDVSFQELAEKLNKLKIKESSSTSVQPKSNAEFLGLSLESIEDEVASEPAPLRQSLLKGTALGENGWVEVDVKKLDEPNDCRLDFIPVSEYDLYLINYSEFVKLRVEDEDRESESDHFEALDLIAAKDLYCGNCEKVFQASALFSPEEDGVRGSVQLCEYCFKSLYSEREYRRAVAKKKTYGSYSATSKLI